ncbi:hypothetical protein UPYG_G00082190, partial [Umbra pygmaea]
NICCEIQKNKNIQQKRFPKLHKFFSRLQKIIKCEMYQGMTQTPLSLSKTVSQPEQPGDVIEPFPPASSTRYAVLKEPSATQQRFVQICGMTRGTQMVHPTTC